MSKCLTLLVMGLMTSTLTLCLSIWSRQADEFAYDNPDHLVLFAAGNSGDSIGDLSITSPSNSKNVLAVGAVGLPRRFYAIPILMVNIADYFKHGKLEREFIKNWHNDN